MTGTLLDWNHDETHLPTLQDPPRPYPWLFGSHENPWRPRCDQRTPRQRPQASGGLNATPARSTALLGRGTSQNAGRFSSGHGRRRGIENASFRTAPGPFQCARNLSNRCGHPQALGEKGCDTQRDSSANLWLDGAMGAPSARGSACGEIKSQF